MKIDILKLSQKAPSYWVLLVGGGLLIALRQSFLRLESNSREASEALVSTMGFADRASMELEQLRSLRDLKRQDLASFKAGLQGAAQSRRSLYESGLALQEEKRLLEKQWEILTTYLRVETPDKKIHVMRGGQSLESYPILYDKPTFLGGENRPLPISTLIIAKERFAHPERGKSEEVNGSLVWTPPQVGASVRAGALGEYVIFTRGPLILHGPPARETEHALFPHVCLGLSLSTARKIYKDSYIGTAISLRSGSSGRGNSPAPLVAPSVSVSVSTDPMK